MPFPPAPADAPERSDYGLTRNAAVTIIAERVREDTETVRAARNRVSHRIGYAVERGELVESSPGYFAFIDLASWAQNKWPGSFNDWPRILSVKPASLKMSMSISSAVVLPTSLKGCHDMILAMHEKITRLGKSLQAAHLEIERLRPDAERWRRLLETRKKNASKLGKQLRIGEKIY